MKKVGRLILKYSEIVAVSFQAETKCNLKLDNGIFKTTNSKNVLWNYTKSILIIQIAWKSRKAIEVQQKFIIYSAQQLHLYDSGQSTESADKAVT